MFPRRRLTGCFLAFLLLAMQAFWLVHRLDHDLEAGANEEAACEFCLAMHGMGAALPGAECVVASLPSLENPPGGESAARRDAEPVQPRQQGPPRLS